MIIERIAVGPLETNCYVLGCPATREAAIVDPGDEGAQLAARIHAQKLTLEWILITHGHGDHIGGNADLKEAFPNARLAIHEADGPCLTDPQKNLSGIFGFPFTSPPADLLLKDKDEVAFGQVRLRVIHVPGHSPGGIAFFASAADSAGSGPVLFSGDALFAGSIGRTDIPGGSHAQLLACLRERLLMLPPATVVYPGHGPETTIEREAKTNPFF